MDDLYGGTNRYLRKVADRMNIKTTFVDATNPENVENAIQENTKVFFQMIHCLYGKVLLMNCLNAACLGRNTNKSHFESK